MPKDFSFTLKLWKEIKNQKNLVLKSEDVFKFMKVINGAADKKGMSVSAISSQLTGCCPFTTKRAIENIKGFQLVAIN